MNRIASILFLSACLTAIQAQRDVFVLVDVSLSVRQSELNDAKQALTEVLTGDNLSKAFVAYGELQDVANFRLNVNDRIAISKFGSLKTTLSIDPNPITVQNISSDVNRLISSITWTPVDSKTYITLAKAKIAEYAKNNNINKYRLCIISDNITDDFGPNGLPNYPDQRTRELAEGYNTTTNKVSESWTRLKFNANSDFSISFSPVDISGYVTPGTGQGSGQQPPPPEPAVITVSSPKGTSAKPAELKSKNLTVSWTCSNCPATVTYSVSISGLADNRNNLMTNTTTFNNLSNGNYRITVSESNYLAESDTTFVTISGGSYVWIIPLILLSVAGGVAYYFWNKNRGKKFDDIERGDNEPIDYYRQDSETPHINTSNRDYF